jgi:AsmA protein
MFVGTAVERSRFIHRHAPGPNRFVTLHLPGNRVRSPMAKPLKIFLSIVGGLLALLVLAAIALPLIFDPNDYKGQAEVATKDATGRELKINGDIGLTVFPWLGASVSDVVLGNARGFGPEPFAQVSQMNVGVKLMPLLFERRVEVSTVRVDGLAVNLAKAADGSNNWSDFGARAEAKKPEEPKPQAGPPLAFTVGGIQVANAAFSYADKGTGATYKVANLALETGPVELRRPLDVSISFTVDSAQPPLQSDVKIAFTARADLDNKVYELKDLSVDSTTKGASVPGGSQKAALRANARYDGAQGSFTLSDAVLEAAGLKVNATLQGTGLAGDAPQLSGKVSSNTFNPKSVAKSFGVTLPPTADPAALTQASFAANIAGGTSSARLEGITLKLDQTTATGNVTVKDFATGELAFALKADTLDADRYLAPAQEGAAKGGEGKDGDFKDTPIPAEALDALNASGTLELGSLKAKGVSLSNIRIVINALKGKPKTQEMTAMLYGGRITQSARYTRNSPARYDVKLGLDAVNSAPLLKDLLGKSYLSGLGNLNLDISSGGATVGAFLQALSGAVGTSFRDGAVEGFNLEQTLAGAQALYAKQPLPESNAPARTQFKDLKATAKIVNGILATDTLDVKGSWYQLGGDGKVNLVEQTVNYILYPTVTGDRFKDLAGTKIPVAITGSWFAPKIKVDLEGVLKGRVKQELKQQEDKLKEKATEKFGDFLQKKLGPKPAPQPAPEAPQDPGT